MKMIPLVFVLLLMASCYRKDFFRAPDEFIPYVENFIAAGHKRGIPIALEKGGLIIEFGTLEKHQLGRSRPKSYPKTITINQEIWQDLDTFQRRALIFHELAHCLLLRKHSNKLLPNGECASLLAGKENDFHCLQNLYSNLWWNYYVDELFNPNVEIPNWYYSQLTNYQQNFEKAFLMNAVNPTFELDSTITVDLLQKHYKNTLGKRGGWFFFDLDTTRNYQIEVTYKIKDDDYKTYQLLWQDLNFIVTPANLEVISLRGTKQAKWNITTSYYEQQLTQNTTSKKLSIRKVNHLLYFFFNEKFMHVVEANYPRGDGAWWNKEIVKSALRTNFIYENETTLEIEVAYLN